WDAYRNRSIGFVFQSYNLIGHQTVLQNVEIALTLSGVSVMERRKRAKEALIEVGLEDQIKKRPNQLSGGQMQRVAIARALVNNPDIILADEPTGALDSHTSVQIMEILKEVAKTRLVIMVTHNGEIAKEYSSRIIRLLDGEIQSDSNAVEACPSLDQDTTKLSKKMKKTSMSIMTAASLSFRNLMTKRGRTIITSFAGSIGIIGVALVLALSNGLSGYMSKMQSDTLSGFPVTISSTPLTINFSGPMTDRSDGYKEYPKGDILYAYDRNENSKQHENLLTEEYVQYIKELDKEVPNTANSISFSYGAMSNLLAKGEDNTVKFQSMGAWQELPDDKKFVQSLYDFIGNNSRMPEASNEIVLVVDEYNRLDQSFLESLGISGSDKKMKLTDFIGKSILKVIPNNDYYTKQGELFVPAASNEYESLFKSDKGTLLTIVGILRPKQDTNNNSYRYLSSGLAYTSDLMEQIVLDAQQSEIANAQEISEKSVLTGMPFANEKDKKETLLALGKDTTPVNISIYPKDYKSKDKIMDYLDEYNKGKSEKNQVIYTDLAATITEMTGTLLDTVTYVLVGFAAISLVVSTIMIAIITYVSVIERTKEIGILRSVGARKKDISRVFNAETLIIGFTAGSFGVILAYLLSIPINQTILKLVKIDGVANLSPIHALYLIIGSMGLTLIAGFIPSRMAAKKDPVKALRTE
ncbi:MAG: ATP-binding cassette domain-containing protein, partial [Lachnospiraceae bacterium]|nr:ATP-binding cassette domain-containing protein [Lachnospiraceae bacterium]